MAEIYDAVIIGAGHNGLVCSAYLARHGLRTLLVEARASVGGTAASTANPPKKPGSRSDRTGAIC